MIVKTRYRDIPFSEIGHGANYGYSPDDGRTWEKRWRGRPIEIVVPASTDPVNGAYCNGPYYDIAGTNGMQVVCPHIAEIGD